MLIKGLRMIYYLLAMLLTSLSVTSSEKSDRIAKLCPPERKTIRCPGSDVIVVVSARYDDQGACPRFNEEEGDCVVDDPAGFMALRCYKKNLCSISDEDFENARNKPCEGAAIKPLVVKYNCVPVRQITEMCMATPMINGREMEMGFVSSPNYPLPYQGDQSCSLQVMASQGQVIRISILDLQLEDHPHPELESCYDQLVLMQRDSQGVQSRTFCQSGPQSLDIIDTRLNFNLTRNEYIEASFESTSKRHNRGFLFKYEVIGCAISSIPKAPVHGRVQQVILNDMAVYACDPGFAFDTPGVATIYCQGNSWQGTPVHCIPDSGQRPSNSSSTTRRFSSLSTSSSSSSSSSSFSASTTVTPSNTTKVSTPNTQFTTSATIKTTTKIGQQLPEGSTTKATGAPVPTSSTTSITSPSTLSTISTLRTTAIKAKSTTSRSTLSTLITLPVIIPRTTTTETTTTSTTSQSTTSSTQRSTSTTSTTTTTETPIPSIVTSSSTVARVTLTQSPASIPGTRSTSSTANGGATDLNPFVSASPRPLSPKTSIGIGIGVGGALAILAILLAILLFVKCRKSRRQKTKYTKEGLDTLRPSAHACGSIPNMYAGISFDYSKTRPSPDGAYTNDGFTPRSSGCSVDSAMYEAHRKSDSVNSSPSSRSTTTRDSFQEDIYDSGTFLLAHEAAISYVESNNNRTELVTIREEMDSESYASGQSSVSRATAETSVALPPGQVKHMMRPSSLQDTKNPKIKSKKSRVDYPLFKVDSTGNLENYLESRRVSV